MALPYFSRGVYRYMSSLQYCIFTQPSVICKIESLWRAGFIRFIDKEGVRNGL